MFEILEHTADIGFRVHAPTLRELFEAAAEALASVALEVSEIHPAHTYPVEAVGEDNESLLVNWLNEVLWLIDGRRLALCQFRILTLNAGRLTAEAAGEPFEPARHHAKLLVKGVTYHQLEIAFRESAWHAQVFLDV
jgi:SHS2 domain-containing protein